MSSIAEHFAKLKELSGVVQRKNYSANSIVELMIKALVTSNMAIQQVASLEAMFMLENPHLNTIYRMLAVLTGTKYIQYLTLLVTRKSPIASQFH
jgi:hypothetical protein